jgi:hypothetical protein
MKKLKYIQVIKKREGQKLVNTLKDSIMKIQIRLTVLKPPSKRAKKT